MPFQALFETRGGERNYIIDDFEAITSMPSMRFLQRSLERSALRGDNMLVVQNPDKSLPYGDYESQQISSRAKNCQILAHDHATREQVMRRMGDADIIPFICHASFSRSNPVQSGLRMADGDLTLSDILLHTKVRQGALVTLAACETGLIDPEEANEFLGLPAGFLYAGASAVLCSHWPVDDLSTALLMAQLYESHQGGEVDFPRALRQAQICLRDASAKELELTEHYRRCQRDLTATTARSDDLSHCKPFQHPYYWSEFSCYGAP